MKQIPVLIILFTLVGSLAADDEAPGIYRSKDRNGNAVFSDRPDDNAERIELQDTNRTPAVTPQPRSKKAENKNKGANYVVSIVQPQNNAVIANGLRPTVVSVDVNPPLLPKHKVEFLLNGERLGTGSRQEYTISRLRPGPHQITAQVVDDEGEPLGEAGSVNVTVYWPGKR